jgi:hypothetical protein
MEAYREIFILCKMLMFWSGITTTSLLLHISKFFLGNKVCLAGSTSDIYLLRKVVMAYRKHSIGCFVCFVVPNHNTSHHALGIVEKLSMGTGAHLDSLVVCLGI